MWPRHVTQTCDPCWMRILFSPQVERVRARRVLGRLWARRSQTCRVLCASRKRTGGSGGRSLLPEAEQTGGLCPLCGGRLSHRMGINGRSKAEMDRDSALILDLVGSTVFPQQGRVLVRSELLTDTKQDPVYVWSPMISKCSKTCGNGEWLIFLWRGLKVQTWWLLIEKSACGQTDSNLSDSRLRRNPPAVVFLCGPPDQTWGCRLLLWCFYQTASSVWEL